MRSEPEAIARGFVSRCVNTRLDKQRVSTGNESAAKLTGFDASGIVQSLDLVVLIQHFAPQAPPASHYAYDAFPVLTRSGVA